MATAILSVGAVAVVRTVRKRVRQGGLKLHRRPGPHDDSKVIDLEAKEERGLWRVDPSSSS